MFTWVPKRVEVSARACNHIRNDANNIKCGKSWMYVHSTAQHRRWKVTLCLWHRNCSAFRCSSANRLISYGIFGLECKAFKCFVQWPRPNHFEFAQLNYLAHFVLIFVVAALALPDPKPTAIYFQFFSKQITFELATYRNVIGENLHWLWIRFLFFFVHTSTTQMFFFCFYDAISNQQR